MAAMLACQEQAVQQPLSASRWRLTESGLEHYQTGTGARLAEVVLPGWSWAREPFSCPPALAVGPVGEVVVTTNVTTALWRVDPVSLEVTRHQPALDADADKDFGFTGLVYSPAHAAYFAATYHGTLWRIDPVFRRAQKIALDAPVTAACAVALRDPGAHRSSDLCVRTGDRLVAVELAPDQRSGAVRLTPPCVPRAGEAASGSGRSTAR